MPTATKKHLRKRARAEKQARRDHARALRQHETKSVTMAHLHELGLEAFRIEAANWLNRVLTQDPLLIEQDGTIPGSPAIQGLLAISMEPSEAGLKQTLVEVQQWAGTFPSRQLLLRTLQGICAQIPATGAASERPGAP